MKLFNKKPDPEEKKALEKLVRDNFCGKESIIDCPYYTKPWCEKNCGFYAKKLNEVKYWNR